MFVRLSALLPLPILALTASLAACVVDDEVPDGLRELRSEIREARLARRPDGSGRLEFTYRYVLGIADDGGIDEVQWLYRLVTRDERVLAQVLQRMREAEPDKTRILVQGDRTRTLVIPPGRLEPATTYVLWITLFYPDDETGEPAILGELLWPVRPE